MVFVPLTREHVYSDRFPSVPVSISGGSKPKVGSLRGVTLRDHLVLKGDSPSLAKKGSVKGSVSSSGSKTESHRGAISDEAGIGAVSADLRFSTYGSTVLWKSSTVLEHGEAVSDEAGGGRSQLPIYRSTGSVVTRSVDAGAGVGAASADDSNGAVRFDAGEDVGSGGTDSGLKSLWGFHKNPVDGVTSSSFDWKFSVVAAVTCTRSAVVKMSEKLVSDPDPDGRPVKTIGRRSSRKHDDLSMPSGGFLGMVRNLGMAPCRRHFRYRHYKHCICFLPRVLLGSSPTSSVLFRSGTPRLGFPCLAIGFSREVVGWVLPPIRDAYASTAASGRAGFGSRCVFNLRNSWVHDQVLQSVQTPSPASESMGQILYGADQAYGGVMAVFWNPSLVKSVLVWTEHYAMEIATISSTDSEREDAAGAGNASTR